MAIYIILASTNSLHSEVPDIDKFVKNALRYVETTHKHGVYPIKSNSKISNTMRTGRHTEIYENMS